MTDTLHHRLRGSAPWPAHHSNQSEPSDTAPHRLVPYLCPQGHTFRMPFLCDDEVKIPDAWECRQHGVVAHRGDVDEPEKATKPARTHWVMLRERRTIAELETLLQERLDDLARCRRARVRPAPAPRGGGGPGGY